MDPNQRIISNSNLNKVKPYTYIAVIHCSKIIPTQASHFVPQSGDSFRDIRQGKIVFVLYDFTITKIGVLLRFSHA